MTVVEREGIVRKCEDPLEVWRAETMFTKEPGTIEWLKGLKPGEVFFDIGANIGIYTDIAARRVSAGGHTGQVYAFEPHVPNAAALLRHIVDAGMNATVKVLTCALGGHEGLHPFHYNSVRAGSSGSQEGHCTGESGEAFFPVAFEYKYVTTLDRLFFDRYLTTPAQVKIDVDGNELDILDGMKGLLFHYPPRSIQVETRPSNRSQVCEFMVEHGYALDHWHYTSAGQKAINSGVCPTTIPSNAVFVKA